MSVYLSLFVYLIGGWPGTRESCTSSPPSRYNRGENSARIPRNAKTRRRTQVRLFQIEHWIEQNRRLIKRSILFSIVDLTEASFLPSRNPTCSTSTKVSVSQNSVWEGSCVALIPSLTCSPTSRNRRRWERICHRCHLPPQSKELAVRVH